MNNHEFTNKIIPQVELKAKCAMKTNHELSKYKLLDKKTSFVHSWLKPASIKKSSSNQTHIFKNKKMSEIS
jgi:hypothetical protein